MDKGSSSSVGDSLDFEADLTLSERLKVFKPSQFDPQSYLTTRCRQMSEKEIRHLCMYLIDLKKASAEEMRKSVYANYSSFIRTSREISDLEGQLIALRNLLANRATLIHGLAEGILVGSMSDGPESLSKENPYNFKNREPSKFEKWLAQFTESLEVLLAERRVEEALNALDEGECIANEANKEKTLTSSAFLSLKETIMEQRKKLVEQLVEAASQASVSISELRSAVQSLKQLGDAPRAHTLLLNSYKKKLQANMQVLQPTGTTCGAAYTTALSQLTFSTIAQAASDSLVIFVEEPAYASEFVTWAVKQTESFARLIKDRVLSIPVAAGGLRTVAECVHISLGHCSLLEARGLALSPVLLRFFRPCVYQALITNLKRIEQSTAALVAADDWELTIQPIGLGSMGSTPVGSVIASQPKLSSSAHRFNAMVQETCEDVGSLESLGLANQALEGILEGFNSFVNMLIKALPGSIETENLEGSESRIVRLAESEAQQVALLANALYLADELLPRAFSKLSSLQCRTEDPAGRTSDKQNRLPEQRELKRRLNRLVDQLKDSFCRQHALELIFTDDGSVRLGSDMYLGIDGNTEEPEWFPSVIYQELYAKLSRLAYIASEVFVGRERFATLLLMRLAETVILWLSDDQSFWEDIEHGPLGPLGLQQFYLDIEFVILFLSQGRYLSRNLHQVIRNIIGRVIEAVSASGVDPYSVLPEDEWFADVAQIAIKMLSGKATFTNVDRDVASPTTSLAASSVYSHGSN